MGRTGGLATYLPDHAALGASLPTARQPRRLAGAGAPEWAPTTLSRLLRAIDLRPVGPQRFEMAAAERQWPAFPVAQLAAGAVVAAERCFPGYSVSHLACAFGRPAQARGSLGIAMAEVRVSSQCVTGRVEFHQGGVGHGEAAVVLQPAAAGTRLGRLARSAQPSRSPDGPAAVAGLRRPPGLLAPWELRTAPARAGADLSRPGGSRVWSRLTGQGGDGARKQSDGDGDALGGTEGRALLAYLSELLPAVAVPCRDRGLGGQAPVVLSHAITYSAPFDPRDWLVATVDSCSEEEGYGHALATFRTSRGAVAAMVSQAAAIWGDCAALPVGERAAQVIA